MSKPEPAPARRFSVRRVIRNVVVLLFLAVLAVGVFLFRDYRRFCSTALDQFTDQSTLDVPLGASLQSIVPKLDPVPVHALYWRLLAREMNAAGRIHAGEYALSPELTPRGLLAKMLSGDVIQHHFTIVEGWTFIQLRNALAQDAGLAQTLPGVDDAQVMQRIGEPDRLPEGEFLPETYSYVKGMTDLDVLRRAHDAMRKTLDKLWSERLPDAVLASPYEMLTLASIVEKETGRAEERPQIARVFLSRLKLGMKLQTDPSVIYGLGASYDGNLHRRDLDTDTPYNTYTRSGLPPTPIAMPGKAALEAVAHPAESQALYFVARGDGAHEFSSTLEAHNRAVAKYQLHRQ